MEKIEVENSDFLNGQRLENVKMALWKEVNEQRKNRVTEIRTFFFGTKMVDPDYWTGSFDIDVPNGGLAPGEFLFEMNPATGICRVGSDTGTIRLVSPIELDATKCRAQNSTETVSLSLETISAPLAVVAPVPAAGGAKTGITYRLPGLSRASLSNSVKTVTCEDSGEQTTDVKLNEIARQFVEIAQLGRLASLPPKVGGMSTQYSLQLDPATGMLREILVGNKAILTSDAIRRTGGVVTGAIDTKRAADAANQAPAPLTEQQKLEKERRAKEELLRIRLLEACLADSSKSGCAALVGIQ